MREKFVRRRKKSRHVRDDSSEIQYQRVQQRIADQTAERAALRRMEITGGDETALGCKSSGWPEYKELLGTKLKGLASNNITRADQAAKVLNAMGFKTGSGQTWTPRLVNVAKFVMFGLLADRVIEGKSKPSGGSPRIPLTRSD